MRSHFILVRTQGGDLVERTGYSSQLDAISALEDVRRRHIGQDVRISVTDQVSQAGAESLR